MARMKFLRDWKKIVLCGSLLLQNWGTTLLLSARDFRFFIVSFFIFASIMLIILGDNNKGNSEEESEKTLLLKK